MLIIIESQLNVKHGYDWFVDFQNLHWNKVETWKHKLMFMIVWKVCGVHIGQLLFANVQQVCKVGKVFNQRDSQGPIYSQTFHCTTCFWCGLELLWKEGFFHHVSMLVVTNECICLCWLRFYVSNNCIVFCWVCNDTWFFLFSV